MKALIDKLWGQLKEYLSKMSRVNKIRLAVLFAVIVILAIVAATLLSRTTFAPLHTATDDAELGRVHMALREMGVPVQIEGRRILVPEQRVAELRGTLAAEGIVGISGPNLDILGLASGFAVTDAHATELYNRQMSEEIRMAILMSPRIVNATVIANRGETSAFRAATGVRAPHASVMLWVAGGDRLTSTEVNAIAGLVRAAVPGITYDNIFITDNNLNTYVIGDALHIDAESEMASRLTIQNVMADQFRRAVEEMLAPVFGLNNIRVTPSLRLNWDRVAQEMTEFSPPVPGELEGMARSIHQTWEAARADATAVGIPGTDSNELGSGMPTYPFGTLEDGETYERRIYERNNEINETRTIIERAQGGIESLAISVLLNSEAITGDFEEEVAELVAMASGISVTNIMVHSLPFAYVDTSLADMYADWEAWQEQERARALIQVIIQYAVILLLGIMVLLLVRTIVKSLKPQPEPEPILVGAGTIDYIADDDYDEELLPSDEVVSYEDVDLVTKAPGLEQIERFIDKDPAAVAQLLRNWLTDE